jgi:5-methylcytosine-specific restriction endonuclease McrA
MRRLCLEPRCPNPPTARGRGNLHRKERERERSRARRERVKDKQGRSVYRTKMWLQRRKQVLSEQPICALCDNRLAVEIDHIVPLTEGGAPYDRENLRGLCRPCHWQRHR